MTDRQRNLKQMQDDASVLDADWGELTRLLRDLPQDHVARAFTIVAQNGLTDSYPKNASIQALIETLSSMPRLGTFPPAILMAELTAHQSRQPEASQLHKWIDATAIGIGLTQDQVRDACVQGRRLLKEPSSLPEQPDDGESSRLQHVSHSTDEAFFVASNSSVHVVATEGQPVSATEGLQRLIRGNIPIRNPDFVGREAILEQMRQALQQLSTMSVLPRALHGLGGVGKTQLAIEYTHRLSNEYDLIWWIPAQHPTQILMSLSTLCDELGLPRSHDEKQTAEAVLRTLNTAVSRWLLVFDNADDPADIVPYIPSSGGHVIITSRNQAWTSVWDSVEVNVFNRTESVELLLRRRNAMSSEDAARLADKLGDLPLALDQAATWQAATGMPVAEYLELFDEHIRELMDEGRPMSYPTTVAAFVGLACAQLRTENPLVSQLLELFAYFGHEPISMTLLRRARMAKVSEPLGQALQKPIELDRAIRELGRHGLAKVDPNRRIHVHRLVQLVLREEMEGAVARRGLNNVQNILASANPLFPDHQETWPVYAEIGPHIISAALIYADSDIVRQVVLDQIRYLYLVGDYEGSRWLADTAVAAWSEAQSADLGPDGEQTLIARRHLANALRDLGNRDQARQIDIDILDRLRRNPLFGPEHEHTLATTTSLAMDLRVAGDYHAALELDRENVAGHQRVFGEADPLTLGSLSSLAVDLRLIGDVRGAHDVDEDLTHAWRRTVGEDDSRYLVCLSHLALDLYDCGRYTDALHVARRALDGLQSVLTPGHHLILDVTRTIGNSLRKVGEFGDSLVMLRNSHRDHHTLLGPDHERTLLATMSYANVLRVSGELNEAHVLAAEAFEGYRRNLGPSHPHTLAAGVNLAIIFRAVGEDRVARSLDEDALNVLTGVLGAEHGHTLCVASNFANDLVLGRDLVRARDVSTRTLEVSRRVRGVEHPYTLACAVNAALDILATGDQAEGEALLDLAITSLASTLGHEHPDSVDSYRFKRAECDIEPPPT